MERRPGYLSQGPAAPRGGAPPGTGLYLYGVVRARGWRARRGGEEVWRVRYRDLEALVAPAPFEVPPLEVERLRAHQRVVEAAMRRATILPVAYGVVFRSRRPLIRFLEDQYLVLDEGLAFLEGHWELRVHLTAPGVDDSSPELGELAARVYSELRRIARAAVPFPREEQRLLSAAFLVERRSWLEFMDRAEDLAGGHTALSLDITGPWPPYDFVRILA